MTARGSSPTHDEAVVEALQDAESALSDGAVALEKVRAALAVDLPALRREAQAQALEEAADDLAKEHTDTSWFLYTDGWLRARAVSLREGR